MHTVSLPWSHKKIAARPHLIALTIITLFLALADYAWPYLAFRPDWLWQMSAFEFQHQSSGILFYIPIIYSALIFRWRGMFIMWLIAVIMTIPITIYYNPHISSVLINMFYLFIPLLIVGYITLEVNWRRRERSTLIEREKERQAFVTQIFQAQEDERKRISQELHDDSIHALLVIANNIRNLTSNGENKTGKQQEMQTEAIRNEVLRVSDDLRRLTLDLRPGILDNIGLLPALRWLVERLNQDGRIDASIEVKGEERKIPPKTDVIVFRIVQEALNNVLHHSSAPETKVTLEFNEETVKISVTDTGKGFTLPKKLNTFASKGKLGLLGIQERARSLNGTLNIKSTPGQGTTISVVFKTQSE